MNDHTERIHAVLSAILLLATALLGYLKFGGALQTSRPTEEATEMPPVIDVQRVTARLWEDPIAAVDRRDTTNATALAHMQDELGRSGPETGVLGVFVEGTPYPEDVEVRLRLRYAVQMAVLGAGFSPHDRTHIGFMDIPWPDTGLVNRTNAVVVDTNILGRLRVPYEWYDPATAGQPRVLVVWLREEQFADYPLNRLGLLVTHLSAPHGDQWQLRVIGPRSSNTLRGMAREPLFDICDYRLQTCRPADYLGRLRIFSAEATAPDPMLLPGWTNAWNGPRGAMAQALGRGLQPEIFCSLIATDDQLAQLIVHELDLRGADLTAGSSRRRALDCVAIVSEADTFYGRALPVTVQAAVLALATDEHDSLPRLSALVRGEAVAPPNVLVYPYLRGLDGRRAKLSDPDEQDAPRPSTPEAAVASLLQRKGEVSKGEAQFDYAERLAERLAQRDAELRRLGEGRIFAVGLTGSDVYDKLILLQALRPRLRDALFFTTDLDARLWDVEHLHHTRNLLVASAYGLQPDDPELRPPPPFRDGYQTAVYRACRVALGLMGPLRAAVTPAPRLFEIGRFSPVPLRSRTGDTPGVDSPPLLTHSITWPLLLILIGATLLTATLGRGANGVSLRRAEVTLIGLGAVVVAAFGWWCSWRAQGPDGEPWRLMEGVSIWPTEIVRGFTGVLTVLLLVGAYREHRERRKDLWSRFFAPSAKAALRLPRWAQAWKELRSTPRKYLRAATSYVLPACLDREGRVIAHKLYRQYLRRAQVAHRCLRLLPLAAGYLALAAGVVLLAGGVPKSSFIRGAFVRQVDRWTLAVTVVLFVILLFYTLDAARLTANLLRRLAKRQTAWPEWVLTKFAAERGVPARHLAGWLDIQFAAEKTREISLLMFLPFLILLLILLARNSYFDHWAWPAGLVIVFFMNFFVAAGCWYCVRNAAKKLRESALKELDHETMILESSLERTASSPPDTATGLSRPAELERLHKLRTDVVNERRGAFSNLIQDPTMVALLIPTGVTGILALFLRQLVGGD